MASKNQRHSCFISQDLLIFLAPTGAQYTTAAWQLSHQTSSSYAAVDLLHVQSSRLMTALHCIYIVQMYASIGSFSYYCTHNPTPGIALSVHPRLTLFTPIYIHLTCQCVRCMGGGDSGSWRTMSKGPKGFQPEAVAPDFLYQFLQSLLSPYCTTNHLELTQVPRYAIAKHMLLCFAYECDRIEFLIFLIAI